MNKKFSVVLLLALLIVACNPNRATKNDVEIRSLDFNIEKIQFSKSFQNLDPFTEVLNHNDGKVNILISLGLTEASNLKISKVLKNDLELDIFIECEDNDDNNELSVPQAIISLNQEDVTEVKDYKINVLGEGYEELKVNISQNDAIAKTDSLFKLLSNSAPEVSIEKIDNNIYWNILYNMAFDKEDESVPIYKFYAKINALTGEVENKSKKLITESIDNGYILEYVQDKLILYRKEIYNESQEITARELWLYNIPEKSKTMLFSTDASISCVQFSPDKNYISFIKNKGNNSSLHIVNTKDKRAYKAPFKVDFNPELCNWKDNNHLYLIEDVKDSSNIYSYDILNNDLTFLKAWPDKIDFIQNNYGKVIFTTSLDKSDNKNIYFVESMDNINLIGKGFHPRIINPNKLIYILDNDKTDYNTIKSYSFDSSETRDLTNGLIYNFQKLSDTSIAFTDKINNLNNYMLYSYDINEKNNTDSITEIAKTISDYSYYVPKVNSFYMNISLPYENNKYELFYLIDINDLK